MGKVIPIANSVNFGMDELSASYAQLTKNGIATAESGTYLKQMLSELGKTGSDADKALREMTGKGFADLKKEGVATADIYDATNNEVAGYTTDMAEATKKMADSEEGSYEQIISAQMRFDEESGNIVLANGEVVGSMEEVTKATDGTRTGIVKINGMKK